MRIFTLVILIVSMCGALADGPSRGRGGHREQAGGPWLGVDLDWVEKGTAAQLKDVPKGFGLLVEEVEPQSPARAAGLQPLDVLWKFNDQFIANKWQLYALMKMEGVGSVVQLSISRAGETHVLPLTIGTRPERTGEIAKAAGEVFMPPIPGDYVRQVDIGKRSGFIAEGDSVVSLSKSPEGYLYSVTHCNDVLHQGLLKDTDESQWPKSLDEKNRRKLRALFHSLLNAEERDLDDRALPRVRRVPTPAKDTKK
ncbi:PDZ domain-containing protein [Roseibacillus persicicus]|uniref:PDZ domain-containing protein n=1 Tax=Roseibacillus persicicus TaxID=454148 RepID=A0A918WLN4_9BACT|nr:PDZ domain-containing protein [Roseibacillus persicicus]MDQ8191923.1 PDZ domain-containing protein [Roseibacillus persicicus]GHC58334.1 hypothetical protein GCM10007100_26610 [Roseibacillus persicicus]